MAPALYPEDLDIRPLTVWPGDLTPADARLASPFSAPLSSTLSTLNRELAAIRAANPVLEAAIDASQFRVDGRPRATARAAHPGVVLSLPTTIHGPLRYATDRFLTWQDNLRGVVLGLEALRRVERYGITRRGEQYTGFRALPAGEGGNPSGSILTEAQALSFLTEHSGILLTAASTPDEVTRAYRRASRALHPDAGGSVAMFQRLGQAYDLLRR